jgi:hypothetical protein
VVDPGRALGRRPRGHTVEVASIDALIRLAERYDRMVLVQHHDDVGADAEDAYVVEDDGIQFLYRSGHVRLGPR